jgi:hypothetical protein
MARNPTYPRTIDSIHYVSITNLKKWDYLLPNQVISGSIKWSNNGRKTGGINIEVDTIEMTIRLYYTYGGTENIDYKVKLVTVPSNIGNGEIIYFLCPHTGKRCRKLYCIGKEFLHRTAYKGVMYESQILSKDARALEQMFKPYFQSDKLYEQTYQKHFKKYYNGKMTKRYKRIVDQLKRADNVTHEDLTRAMITGKVS